MKCPNCGSEKVTSLHGGLIDRCTKCGHYFSDKSHIGKFFDYVHKKTVWNIQMEQLVDAMGKDEK